MEIESFLKKSEGNWVSMRSGHSLAFKQFEEVVSNLKIKILDSNESRVLNFLKKSNFKQKNLICPFEIKCSFLEISIQEISITNRPKNMVAASIKTTIFPINF